MNHQTTTTRVAAITAKPTSPCDHCSAQKPWFLHLFRHHSSGGALQRLCTSCTLLLHPSSFCPTCLSFYSSLPPAATRLSCSSCSSLTHSHCSPTASTPFRCLSCTRSGQEPNFSFFRVDPANPVVDRAAASALLCAAKISAAAMAKDAAQLREVAVNGAREAALSKKRAREELEKLYTLEEDRERLLRGVGEDERVEEEEGFASTVTHHH
ncbi:hypothetical protein Tsubulata_028597 [Turnera subulata]|uniref:Uncharacterized protein n=1 Tax=Turnera subulata TaxID=218843 RepID=A0A9Q0FBJ9_9ROSI|nr:hypothetical protein Tsubulata_028597 [Turnera subulata]